MKKTPLELEIETMTEYFKRAIFAAAILRMGWTEGWAAPGDDEGISTVLDADGFAVGHWDWERENGRLGTDAEAYSKWISEEGGAAGLG